MAGLDLSKLAKQAELLGLKNVKPGDLRLLAKISGAETQDEDTKPTFTPQHAQEFLLRRWGKLPYFDVLTGTERMDTGTPRGLNDALNHLVFDAQLECGGARGREVCRAAIDVLASLNPRNRWLESIPDWDGQPRFEALSRKLGISLDGANTLRDWLLALVGMQVFRTELEHNLTQWRPPMLILFGTQGGGKNWLLKQLCLGVVGAYNEKVSWAKIIENGRDEVRRLKRCVIASFDENPTGIGRETYDVKAWITTTHCATRGIHALYDDPDNVICSGFAGTSNFKNMLTDISGNRRFYILDLTNKKRILHFDFPQLLAEVKGKLPKKLDRFSVPWVVPTTGKNDKQFDATHNCFDAAIIAAFKACKGLTTQRNIVDNLAEVEARAYYLRDPYRLPRRLGELFDYDGELYHERG